MAKKSIRKSLNTYCIQMQGLKKNVEDAKEFFTKNAVSENVVESITKPDWCDWALVM